MLDMEVDEALKMIISLGVVVPPWRNGPGARLPSGEEESRPVPAAVPDEK